MNTYEHDVFPRESEQLNNVSPVWQDSPPADYPQQAAPDPVFQQPRQASRKESPYADSPYVMHHQPQYQTASQYDPYTPQKPPRQKKKAGGFWKKLLATVLVLALVAGSCGITATVINRHWESRIHQMEESFAQQMNGLQNQISSIDRKQSAVGIPVNSGEILTPTQVYAYNVDKVVAITANVKSTAYGQVTEGTSAGSGFILTENGYVITNCHVVDGASSVTVTTHDGTEYPATIVGSDATNDVAVLKVEATGLPAVTVGSSDALSIGDMVVAIGNPLGTLSSTQTVGYVSGKDRDISTDGSLISMLQTDAAINSGNSGGPLFNMHGELVGITTAKYSGTSTSGASIEGIGFAIPIDDVNGIINDLIDYGYVTGAYLGVTVSNTDDSASMFGLPSGAYVMEVVKDGSADRAGIRAKDIIIDLGGYKVTGITSLTRALRNFKAGDVTTVTVIRSGAEMKLDITLDEKPQDLSQPSAQPENPADMPSEGNLDEWYEFFRRHYGNQSPFGD